MRIRPTVIAFLLSALLCVVVGEDAVGRTREISAQAEIEACWKVSQAARDSGVTAEMRKGTLATAKCMEARIVEHLAVLFHGMENDTFPDGKTRMNREGFQELLARLRTNYGGLYWSIYNDHAGCEGGCGTMYQTFHLAAYAALLEKILKDVVAQRNEYGL